MPAGETEGAGPGADLRSLLYGACHDLKDPLRVIVGHLELLEAGLGDRLSEDEREHLGFAIQGAQQAQSLLTSLLDHARVDLREEGGSRSDLDSILEEVLDNLDERLDAAGARVTHDDLPTLYVNRREIIQLFQNLIENAIKYRGDEAPRIHVSHEKRPQGHRLSVSDNGIGIPADKQEEVFEMFTRGQHSENGEGDGMGLALCRGIVENHQGRIWIESEPGEGSTFLFTLRLQPKSAGVKT